MYHRVMAEKESGIPFTGRITMETALQRIIRKTGRRLVECRCPLCRQQCHTLCLGTPEDILRLLKAGYKERLTPTGWAVGLLYGKLRALYQWYRPGRKPEDVHFPGRLMRAALYRTQTYGRKTVISHHHKGEPEIQQIALLERAQGVAGRTECRYDTGDLPADGDIVGRRLRE